MDNNLNRRDWMRYLGISGIAAGMIGTQTARAQNVGESSGFQSSVLAQDKVQFNGTPAILSNGKIIQPQHEIPLLSQTDVLVVGGGPAGICAALAAARAGSKVTLVERYGHFGGLWTGGLVLLILGHIAKGPKQVCQGLGEEIMQRLDKMDGAIIDRQAGKNPTVDAEAVKYLMVEMVEEAGIQVYLHCWGVNAIVRDNTVQGAVFESKAGRQAIQARVVIDATGDGDIFAAAGAEFEHRSHNIGLVCHIANLDRVDRDKAGDTPRPGRLGNRTPISGVNWINLTGPKEDGLDLATLTRMEMSQRKFIWKDIQKKRILPGYDKIYLTETAPQLGVRITRVLDGVDRIRLDAIKKSIQYPDVIGVGGASSAEHAEWQIPYGALVPEKVDNVLAAGRCVSADMQMADLVRLIPNCFVTGHAAGVAAAVSVQQQCPPRQADIKQIQKILLEQKAYLG